MKYHTFIISLFSTFFVLILHNLGCFQLISLAILDQYFRFKPKEVIDPRIILVQVTEKDIQSLGRYPFNDSQWLKILSRIEESQPSVIGFDIFRDFPVPPGEQSFALFLATQPNIIGITYLHSLMPHSAFKKGERYGDVALPLDADGVVRRAFLWPYPQSSPDIPNFGLKIAYAYLATQGITPQDQGGYLKLGKTVFSPLTSNFGDYVKLGEGGYQIFLNWRSSKFKTLSVQDILLKPVSELKGCIVLVGIGNTQSIKDLHQTPFGRRTGIEYQAHLTSQIIAAALDERPLLRSLSQETEWLWIFFTGLIIGVCIEICHKRTQKSKPQLWIWCLGAIWSIWSIILIAATYVCFIYGWWIPLISAWVNASAIGLLMLINLHIKQLEFYLAERNRQLRKAQEYYQLQTQMENLFLQLEENLNLIIAPTVKSIDYSGQNLSALFEQLSTSIEELSSLRDQYPLIDEYNLNHIKSLMDIINIQQNGSYDFIDQAILEMSKLGVKNHGCITSTFSTPKTLDLFLEVLIEKLDSLYQLKGLAIAQLIQLNIQPSISLPVHPKFRIHLLHLLTNLLDNSVIALFSTAQDYPFISINSWSQGSKLFLEIYDNGIGIEPTQIQKIFEPFTSFWATPRVGFGLAKCKKIVQSYQGNIKIESKSQHFTKIKVELIMPDFKL